MKTVIAILITVMALALAGCAEQTTEGIKSLIAGEPCQLESLGEIDLSATILVNTDDPDENNQTLRVGATYNQIEIGPTVELNQGDDDEWGVYVLRYLTDENGLGLLGKPYIGFQAVLSGDGYNFLTGTSHTPYLGVDILTEVRAFGQEEDDTQLYLGTRIEF